MLFKSTISKQYRMNFSKMILTLQWKLLLAIFIPNEIYEWIIAIILNPLRYYWIINDLYARNYFLNL